MTVSQTEYEHFLRTYGKSVADEYLKVASNRAIAPTPAGKACSIRASKSDMIYEFSSQAEAAKQLGVSASQISVSLRKGQLARGWKIEKLKESNRDTPRPKRGEAS